MPCSSRTSQSSAWMRGSSPFQKAQNGSSPGSAESTAPLGRAESCATSGTSQSAHTVNPWRYSALHSGQIITTWSLLHAVDISSEVRGELGGADVETRRSKSTAKPGGGYGPAEASF